MGFKVKKTEHSGPKKGKGAFYGPKRFAKAGSNKVRRQEGKKEERAE